MKIAIVNSMVPFVWGGAEELVRNFVLELHKAGHEAELVRIPFTWEPYGELPREIARAKLFPLPKADMVISMKFPFYLMDAPNHRTWLIHQFRQAYDMWNTQFQTIPDNAAGRAVRDLIIAEDTQALASREKLFTISAEISDRLRQYNGIDAAPLRAPLNDPQLFVGGDYGDYIVAPGRVNPTKRQHLLIEAMRYAAKSTRLVIAGPPDSPDYADELRKLVDRYGLNDRVKLDLQFFTREALADYVNGARAVAYLPFLEDSYGYVTMEGYEARKPVITVDDSGELLALVEDGVTGFVCSDEQGLAKAMDAYLKDEALARHHGEAGFARWREKDVNWPANIKRLIGV